MRADNKLILRLLLLLLIPGFSSCDMETSGDYFRDADFNDGWNFHLGDLDDPFLSEEDDQEWIPVHLPHDWSIIDYEIQDSLHEGPFYKNLPGGRDVGIYVMEVPGTGRSLLLRRISGSGMLS